MTTRRFLPTLLVLMCLLTAAAVAQSGPQSQIQQCTPHQRRWSARSRCRQLRQQEPSVSSCRAFQPRYHLQNARTPANSDFFPGLLALVTGGSPVTTGLFDMSAMTARSSIQPISHARVRPATSWSSKQSIDLYNKKNVSQDVIDPARLPRVRDRFGNRVALYPPQRSPPTPFSKSSRRKAVAPPGRTSIPPMIW